MGECLACEAACQALCEYINDGPFGIGCGQNGLRQGKETGFFVLLPAPAEIFSSYELAFFQCGIRVLTKTQEDCTIDERNILHCVLSPEDTLLFSPQRFTVGFRGIDAAGQSFMAEDVDFTVSRGNYKEGF